MNRAIDMIGENDSRGKGHISVSECSKETMEWLSQEMNEGIIRTALTNKEVRFDRTANARICAISRLCNFRWVIVKQVCDAYKARELHDSSRPTLGETYKAICDDLESNSDSRNENCIDRSVSPLDDTCNSNFSDDESSLTMKKLRIQRARAGENANAEEKNQSVHEEEPGYEALESY
ncbi:hypothetical protein L917_20270, partial [Phytophthora nicotianae]